MPPRRQQCQASLVELMSIGQQSPDGGYAAWSRDGRSLALYGADGVSAYDMKEERIRWVYRDCANSYEAKRVSWSHDGRFLAVADDGIILLDAYGGNAISSYQEEKGKFGCMECLGMAWTDTDCQIISYWDDNHIRILNVGLDDARLRARGKSPLVCDRVFDLRSQVSCIAFSSSARSYVTADRDTISVWGIGANALRRRFGVGQQRAEVTCIAVSSDETTIAVALDDNSLQLWDLQLGQCKCVLGWHEGRTVGIVFSLDGRLLATRSTDGMVRIFDCSSPQLSAVLESVTSFLEDHGGGLAFDPTASTIAVYSDRAKCYAVYRIELTESVNGAVARCGQYTNAKVVLVGNTGVGKTGLALRLTGQDFRPTESTHGRYVQRLTASEAEAEPNEDTGSLREIYLWDLAGQPGYRIVHQLSLHDVSVALVVFDARHEDDPFSGVYHWVRALKQAERLKGTTASPLMIFLVAARTELGGISASRERIQAVVDQLGCVQLIETSAKEDIGIKDLAKAISLAIDWDALPYVISTQRFESVRDYLLSNNEPDQILAVLDMLCRQYCAEVKHGGDESVGTEDFTAAVCLLESMGLVRRLAFGGLLLLRPEILDTYASAIVIAAGNEPDGLGVLMQDEVVKGRLCLPDSRRIANPAQEELVLIATVEELLRREIVLREQTADGTVIVFPYEFRREWSDAPDPQGKAIVYEFEGPVANIYATLVVRLSRSGVFSRAEMWRKLAVFKAATRGRCGVQVQEVEEGRGQLTLFFDKECSEEVRFQFENFVHVHLQRRVVPESVSRRRVFVCEGCETVLTDQQVNRRRQRGFDWIPCNVCDGRVSLLDGEDRLRSSYATVAAMDSAADTARDRDAASVALQGKIATGHYDVFLAHNSRDKQLVTSIADQLRARGLNPWLDAEQIAPGMWFQDVIQHVIPRVKSAAIVLGANGIGRWQALEIRAFVSQCAEREIRVIPVLLPGVTELPDPLLFLNELNWVRFDAGIDDTAALDRLEWGISGHRPVCKS